MCSTLLRSWDLFAYCLVPPKNGLFLYAWKRLFKHVYIYSLKEGILLCVSPTDSISCIYSYMYKYICIYSYTYKRTATLQHNATHCTALHHTATHWNTLQHTATHWNTLQHTTTHCNTVISLGLTHCNTLQHTATNCNTLQHTATQWYHWGLQRLPMWTTASETTSNRQSVHSLLQCVAFSLIFPTATLCNTLQESATLCHTLQRTATHCNTLQHTATHFGIVLCHTTAWNKNSFSVLQCVAECCSVLQTRMLVS